MHNLLMTALVFVAGLILAVVIVLVYLAVEWMQDLRAKRKAEDERVKAGIEALRAIPPAVDLSQPDVHIAPSPMIPTRRLSDRWRENAARLEQQARHANVVTAAAPDTTSETTHEFNREFNAIAERTTGRPPRRRGPREATLPARRLVWEPGQQWPGTPEPLWQQDMLPIEVA